MLRPTTTEGLLTINSANISHAIADYNEAISLKPDYAEAYYNRGNAYYKLDQYQQAIEDYNKAIYLETKLCSSLQQQGECHIYLKETKLLAAVI